MGGAVILTNKLTICKNKIIYLYKLIRVCKLPNIPRNTGVYEKIEDLYEVIRGKTCASWKGD